MIRQELLPFPDLSVAANIFMGQEPASRFLGWLDKGKMHHEAEKSLGRLGVTLSPARRMGELSVAETQTVEIAKALVHRARVIVMDEPTSAISEREVTALFGVIRELKAQGVLAIVLVVICAGLALPSPNILTVGNRINVVRQISLNGILAVGVTYVLLTGGVDLSLGSVVALTGVVTCFAHPGQYPVVVPVLAGILAGTACGAVNGIVVTTGRVAPFIVTLGMMTVARGLALVISGGKPVSNLSDSFKSIGGDVAGFPVPILILLAAAGLSWTFPRDFANRGRTVTPGVTARTPCQGFSIFRRPNRANDGRSGF